MKFSSEYYSNLEARIPTGNIRTRFAPSPTGYMHLGGLRTALYCYLLAKKSGGSFILRIEDTDQERFIEGAAELIYSTLKSAGLNYDEGPDIGGPVGPYIQSERREIYLAYIELLIERGQAYYCFCNKETLDEQRSISRASRIPHKYDGRCALLAVNEIADKLAAKMPYVVRQKMPAKGSTFFDDLIFGRIEVENATLDDSVLLKSDGMPTYNFANVVDDHLMGITHIIRGSEFLSSTPKYNMLYEGFGWEPPKFVHCSPIMRDAVHKLSKRDGDAYFNDFVEKGYLVDAILNYIALLGWSPGGEEEKFTLSELVSAFDIKGISKDPSIFDYKNLNSLNGSYIRAMSDEDFHSAALPYIKKGVKRAVDTVYVASILKERCELLSEIPELLDFIDAMPIYSPELYINKKMKTDPENSREALTQILPVLEKTSDWNTQTVQDALLKLVEQLGLKNGRILWPLRVALSGKTFTPGGGIEICVLLGKEETLDRINKAIKMLESFNAQPQETGEVAAVVESPVVPESTTQQDNNTELQGTSKNPLKSDFRRQNASICDENCSEAMVFQRPLPLTFLPESAVSEAHEQEISIREKLHLTDAREINRIAALAKLNVKDKAEQLSKDIQPIMDILDKLIDMALPMGDYPLDLELTNVFREDIGTGKRTRDEALAEREKLLAIAPEVEAGCVSVPKILGREE